MSLIRLNTRCKVKLTFGKPNCSNSFLNSFASNSYRTAPRTIVSIKLVQISIVSRLVVSSVKSVSVSGGGFGGGASAFSFSSRSSSPNDDETIRAQNALVKSNTRTHVSFSDKTWVMSFRNCAVGGWSPRKRGRIMCIMCVFIICARQMLWSAGTNKRTQKQQFLRATASIRESKAGATDDTQIPEEHFV